MRPFRQWLAANNIGDMKEEFLVGLFTANRTKPSGWKPTDNFAVHRSLLSLLPMQTTTCFREWIGTHKDNWQWVAPVIT
jgi:hypothetical protein